MKIKFEVDVAMFDPIVVGAVSGFELVTLEVELGGEPQMTLTLDEATELVEALQRALAEAGRGEAAEDA